MDAGGSGSRPSAETLDSSADLLRCGFGIIDWIRVNNARDRRPRRGRSFSGVQLDPSIRDPLKILPRRLGRVFSRVLVPPLDDPKSRFGIPIVRLAGEVGGNGICSCLCPLNPIGLQRLL